MSEPSDSVPSVVEETVVTPAVEVEVEVEVALTPIAEVEEVAAPAVEETAPSS